MTEDTRKFVEEKTKEILNAGSCCPELKEMAEKWLAAEETTDEKAVAEETNRDTCLKVSLLDLSFYRRISLYSGYGYQIHIIEC